MFGSDTSAVELEPLEPDWVRSVPAGTVIRVLTSALERI
jgi:hypothetical protein